MKLRVLLALQLVGALAVLSVFVYLGALTFWDLYGKDLPQTVLIGSADVPLIGVIFSYGVMLLILTALIFVFVFLLLDRLFIHPIKIITGSMRTFTESSKFTPLPHMSLSAREIRELAKVYVEFTDSVERVHERDMEISRVKTDFISTAAHQLRTPLTGIRWALEALAKDPLPEAQRVLVEDAVNKSRDLVAIVGTLLDISSIESGKHKYVFGRVALEELAQTVVRDFAHLAGEKEVTLVFEEISEYIPPVRADVQQVKWVLNNLVENAIRYTPHGGTVRVAIGQVPDRVQVLVRDTGIGITAKDRNNIFERFYRADNAIAKENKGNGLGLYIARTIATDHGGDLNFAANDSGPGTTFTLSLPVAL